MLLNLQLSAESQLRDARQAQQRLLAQSNKKNPHLKNSRMDSDLLDRHMNGYMDLQENSNSNNKISNEITVENLREIDERIKQLNQPRSRNSSNVNENLYAHMENLQQHIGLLRDSNESRSQLIHILDNRDTELQNEHKQLQEKLTELQKKKNQVDQLVSQLQSMNEESEEEDVGMYKGFVS